MRHPRALTAAVLAALAAASPSPAQGTLVSPASRTASDDPSFWSALPLLQDTSRRHLQIHSDLVGSTVAVKKIALRRDQTSARGSGIRRLDCELYCGASVPWTRPSWTFAANYTGPRTRVTARRYVDLPLLTSTTNPAAFELGLTLDSPWVLPASSSFAWELVVFGTLSIGTYATRVDSYSASITSATSAQTGIGCWVTGRSQSLLHTLQLADGAGTLSFAGYVDNAPANASCILMLGFANPNASVPGLCSPVYTDLLLQLPIGSTDANGFLGEMQNGVKAPGGTFAFALPNPLPAATMYSQVHVLDFPSTWPLKLANSDGRSWTIPSPDLSRPNRVSRVYNDDGQPAGTTALYAPEMNVGYGVVVQLTY